MFGFCCGKRKKSSEEENSKNQQEQSINKSDKKSNQEQLQSSQLKSSIDNLEFSGYLIYQDQYAKCFSEQEWNQILDQDLNIQVIPQTELRTSLRKGIPDNLRPKIWFWLANVSKMEKKYNGLYQKYKNIPNIQDEQIKKDINRTFPETAFFNDQKGQDQLFNILRAYSNYDKDVGYMQGLNCLVGSLLVILQPDNFQNLSQSMGITNKWILSKSDGNQQKIGEVIDQFIEEKIFWILVHICINKNWRLIYKEGLQELMVQLRFLDKRIKEVLPDVYNRIKLFEVSLVSCFSEVYITALLMHSPLELQIKIIDSFLLEGDIILIDIIIRIMKITKLEILDKKDQEELMNFLKYDMINYAFKNYGYQLIPQAHSSEILRQQNQKDEND